MSRISKFPRAERQTGGGHSGVGRAGAAPSGASLVLGGAAVALSEIFAENPADAGAAGFMLAQIGQTTRPILWIQDRMSRQEAGRPHLPGLGLGRSLLLLAAARPADVLIEAEEGLRCKALAAVVAELWGNPTALSFTATKRLALRAEAIGVPCWLLRHGASPDLSAARDRWRIGALPSALNPDDTRAPGDPRWRLELFRSRDKRPGVWLVQHDRATDRLDLTAAVSDGAVAADATADGQSAARRSAAGSGG